ncbi:MAG: SPOR domain-containing protein [Rhodospirillales bacterium]|jgi:cell division septation protein DedD|nr:SPOR domain-containing protein [Rhodospirillales bacterium]MDP6805553.1 SPOR domain-containing protein [Rhodospirillales bacterium]
MAAGERVEPGEADESLDFEPVVLRPRRRRSALTLSLSALVLMAAGAGAGWYAFENLLEPEDPFDVPLIRSDAGPIKVRPAEPGGMEVPHRDKLVYERLLGTEPESSEERLMPPAETPLALPGAPAASETGTTPPEASEVDEPVAETELPPATPTAAEVIGAKRPEPPPPPPDEPVAPARAQARAPVSYQVQLAAIRSSPAAEDEWNRLRRRHADLLGGFGLTVIRADLGPAKGIFYRVRVGPLDDEAAARGLCAQLAERKVGCLVVSPGQ